MSLGDFISDLSIPFVHLSIRLLELSYLFTQRFSPSSPSHLTHHADLGLGTVGEATQIVDCWLNPILR